MFGPNPTRREFMAALGALGLGAVAAACTGSTPTPSPSSPGGPPDSIGGLISGAQQLGLLSGNTGPNRSPLPKGKTRFPFALTTSNGGLLTGGTPQVYVGKSAGAKALGPYPAAWEVFTAYGKTGDTSPQTALPGTYVVDLELPGAGDWLISAIVEQGSQRAQGTDTTTAMEGLPALVGSKATSVKTPVATADAKIAEICTRKPVDHMHYISLDAALRNGKPTVVSFATPALCESKLCGPVVDEQLLVFEKIGGSKANFIHIEEFLPGPDLQPPAPTLENTSAGFHRWGFVTEPWLIVIDRKGTIRARLEGPTVAAEIEAALRPLL